MRCCVALLEFGVGGERVGRLSERVQEGLGCVGLQSDVGCQRRRG